MSVMTMDCEQALNLISARIDGEAVAADDNAALDAHLSSCEACRATEEAMRIQDATLDDAFSPHRKAATRLAQRFSVALSTEPALDMPHSHSRFKSGWLVSALAMAAGFMLAVAVFRPWEKHIVQVRVEVPSRLSTGPSPREQLRCATLSIATGRVEIQSAETQKWEPLATGAFVCVSDVVRTGPDVRCEFVTTDGSEVRLNSSTQLLFKNSREVDLAGGQLWSTVNRSKDPFLVKTQSTMISALGSKFDVQHEPDKTTLTVMDGSTKVVASKGERTVQSGQRVQIIDGSPGEVSQAWDLALATRWVNELLILKGRDNDELRRRVDELFAQIGETKMSSLYQEEIRALGDHCVVPLSRYIRSERSRAHDDKRREAMRIVADVSQPWSAGELIELLGDRDREIRGLAAGALQRVTGESMGRSPDQWREQRPGPDDEPLKRWRKWWEQNKSRFPGTPLPTG